MSIIEARAALAAAFRRSFRIVGHDMTEQPEPEQRVAFVQLPGATSMKAAIWRHGEWRSEKGKPFPELPVRWFSVEPAK